MKNVAAVILTIALFSPALQAQPADSLEYALSFYPIQIGNQWDYYDDGNRLLPPEKTYIKIQVTGDTLIHGQTYQIMHQRRWHERFWVDPGVWVFARELYTYERVDSSTANVYAWAAHFDSPREVLIDSLLVGEPESEIPAYRMIYTQHSDYNVMVKEFPTILHYIEPSDFFGQAHVVRTFGQDGLNWLGYGLGNRLGIVSFYFGGAGSGSKLVYARINGEEFGERIFTNLDEPDTRPVAIRLHPNYPNPFNPSTNLRYDLDEPGPMRLEVFDLTGRRVALLSDGPASAGRHTAEFNATGLSSGIYIARLTAGGTVQHRKMLLVR